MFTTQGTHKQRGCLKQRGFQRGHQPMGVSNQWVNGWWPGKPVVVLTACFACVMLTWPWDQWKIPKFEVVWLVLDLLCLPRVFLQSACLGRVSTACSCAWLDPCCTVFMVHPLFSFSDYPCDTSYPPLNREGALVLRLRSRRFRQKLDYMGVVLKPMQDL